MKWIRGLPRFAVVGMLLLSAALLLAACGDDDDSDANGDGDDHAEETADADHDDGDSSAKVTEVDVVMTDDLTFEPDEIEVPAGHPVHMTIENSGQALHDFTIDHIAVHVEEHEGDSEDPGHGGDEHEEFDLHMALDGDASGTLEFTPEEPGEYEFRCTVPGHTEGGMIGTLIVTEA